MPRASLSRRLIAALSGVLVVLWLVAIASAGLVMRAELDEVLDASQVETAQRLLALAVEDILGDDDSEGREPTRLGEVSPHEELMTYQVRSADGRVLLRSHAAPAEPFAAPLRTGFAEAVGLRIYTEGTVSDSLFIQVAEPIAYRREAILESLLPLFLPLLVLVPVTMLCVASVVRWAMRPVLALGAEISRRGGGNLTAIGPDGLPREIAPIAEAVDRLLARLRSALEAERAFAANSAHELRTPIAAALAQLQRLRASLGEAGAGERLDRVEAELRRLAGLTEKLLQLARADAGMSPAGVEQDLMPVLGLLVAELARAPHARGRLRLALPAEGRLPGRIDPDAFAILMRNLIENALLHGAADEPVEVRSGGTGSLSIVNGGPPVPPEELQRLPKRFVRGRTRAGGSGLGLAIADTILKQSGGRLELHSPALGRGDGFEAVVVLPDGVPADTAGKP